MTKIGLQATNSKTMANFFKIYRDVAPPIYSQTSTNSHHLYNGHFPTTIQILRLNGVLIYNICALVTNSAFIGR